MASKPAEYHAATIEEDSDVGMPVISTYVDDTKDLPRPIAYMVSDPAPGRVRYRRGTVSLRSSEDHVIVREQKDRSLLEADPRETAGRYTLLSEMVHFADETLKEFLRTKHPEWESYLHVKGEKNAQGTTHSMLVDIDSVNCMDSVNVPYEGFTYRLGFDSLKHNGDLNGSMRLVFVESIEYRYGVEGFDRLRIILRDNVFEARTEGYIDVPDLGYLCDNPYPVSMAVALESEQEKHALESLREMITEGEWRRYLKRGFITAKGASGKEYQIFRGRWHSKVRLAGKIVAEICSHISDDKVPPTDSVIAFKTMIEADESEFERIGNVYRMGTAA